MRRVTVDQGRPVAMFAQDDSIETIRAAIEAGVSAYVVGAVDPARVKPVIDAAIAHFERFQRLQSELDKAKTTLTERKRVERAKGILMARRSWTEDQAYRARLLRRRPI